MKGETEVRGSEVKKVMEAIIKAFKKAIKEIAWKIRLFCACVTMDVKNYRLKRRIEVARAKTAEIQNELNKLREERT